MEQWRNLIHINRNFQKAVNLQLDIGDHGRIEHYIPTRSSMLILRRYLKAVTGEAKEHATVLIGPYGKGKSHLLLDRKSTRLNSSHRHTSRMPSSA